MGVFVMAKYSFDFKQKLVNEYLQGKTSYDQLAKKYRVPGHACIEKWVAQYLKNGPQSLQRSRQQKTYSFQFKRNAVELYLSTEISYKDLALSLGINTPSILVSWVQRYHAVGVEGLKMQRKGRRPKVPDKPSTSPTSPEEQNERLKQLEEENLRLRIEVAYLKEVRRLRLAQEVQRSAQGLSTVSEKHSD